MTFLSLLNLFFFTTTFAQAETNLESVLKKLFPNNKIISQKECDLGAKRIKTIAVVIQKDLKNQSSFLNPLEAVILIKDSDQTFVLSKHIENSKGSDKDFLSDFWSKNSKSTHPIEIRCIHPNKDPDITTKANGEFKSGFHENSGQHLCYQASRTYNNWACYNLNSQGNAQSSYVQINAD